MFIVAMTTPLVRATVSINVIAIRWKNAAKIPRKEKKKTLSINHRHEEKSKEKKKWKRVVEKYSHRRYHVNVDQKRIKIISRYHRVFGNNWLKDKQKMDATSFGDSRSIARVHRGPSLPIENRRWIEFKANAFISVYRSLRREGITIVNGRGSIAVPTYDPTRFDPVQRFHATGLTFSNRPSSDTDPIPFFFNFLTIFTSSPHAL